VNFNLLVLSFIQGVTEFLPISSSGHLLYLSRFLNWHSDSFSLILLLHLATLLAIVVYLFPNIKALFKDRDYIYKIFTALSATIVVAVVLRSSVLDIYKIDSLNLLGILFLINGLILFVPGFKVGRERGLNFRFAILIGSMQGLAVLPGISRSGITIAAALMLGLAKDQAFNFSFLLAIPTIIGAFLFEYLRSELIFENLNIINGYNLIYFFVTFIVGLLSLYLLKRTVFRKKLSFFGYYCCIIGLIVLFIGG
jgi:undecaprenyl-diphosphatase